MLSSNKFMASYYGLPFFLYLCVRSKTSKLKTYLKFEARRKSCLFCCNIAILL